MELSETDCAICMMAVEKCQILKRAVDAGLTLTLTQKTFGFAELTNEEESLLVEKLYQQSQIAWLRETKGR